MDFPIADLMDEDACDAKPASWPHPDGLACPRCRQADRMLVHRRHRAAVLDYRCGHCRRVFNASTGTSLHGTRRPIELVLIVRGVALGVPTARLARELGCDRSGLPRPRHRLQGLAHRNRDRMPLDDPVPEADEAYQDAGGRGVPHADPADPARRRGNKARGHGTWDDDRPPVCGAVGRESGRPRLTVVEHSDGATLRKVVRKASWPMVTVNTDAWRGYEGLPGIGRLRVTVCHADRGWARDGDGDGVREVHVNTLEGTWTGLRNLLRPFPGRGQEIPVPVCGDLRVGLQRQAGDDGIPQGAPRRRGCHQIPYMSQGFEGGVMCRLKCCHTGR